ncbi:MAG: hypothetical protein COB53_00135 [Elusimicrobia bacterium]|nr:MAG: hypothetical protein COB53_00135 [Elusimicrobiota bacterium]
MKQIRSLFGAAQGIGISLPIPPGSEILLIGAGSLGRVLAARMEHAGFSPIFFRPPNRKPLADHGTVEEKISGKVFHHAIRSVALLPFDLSRFKAVGVLVRYESLATVLDELCRRENTPPVAVFTPILFPAELEPIAMRASTTACFPEIAALPPEDNRVVYTLAATQEFLSVGDNPLASVLWAELLKGANIPARFSERPLGELCAKYSYGIPLLMALELSEYNTGRLARDQALIKTAWHAAAEGMQAGRSKGCLPGFGIRLLAKLPAGPIAFAASLVLRILPTFPRRMLEEHFKKVSEQTRLACSRLAKLSPEGSALRRLVGT